MSVIVAEDLIKVYDKKVVAVNGVSFEVREGEVFGFLGPNGAGKSTTINMLTGVIKPTGGTLQILGHSMPNGRDEVQSMMGYVPQELVFFDYLTVDENLRLFGKSYGVRNLKPKMEEVKKLLGLTELSDRRAENMSGGQKRRLNLALALLHQPKLLILDEPSAGMDPQSRNILWKSIAEMAKQNMTIILTTHLMETADRLCDRICIIDHGEVKVVDTPNGLKDNFGDGDVVLLKFKDELDDSQLQPLKNLVLEKYQPEYVHSFDHTMSITDVNGVDTISQVIVMVEQTIGRDNIESLSLRDNTLEDVFIHITGRTLRE